MHYVSSIRGTAGETPWRIPCVQRNVPATINHLLPVQQHWVAKGDRGPGKGEEGSRISIMEEKGPGETRPCYTWSWLGITSLREIMPSGMNFPQGQVELNQEAESALCQIPHLPCSQPLCRCSRICSQVLRSCFVLCSTPEVTAFQWKYKWAFINTWV